MNKSRGSLSGQNTGGRTAGVGSSPAPSAKSVRTRLWGRLRKYDRQIAYLDENVWLNLWRNEHGQMQPSAYEIYPVAQLNERREKLDAKRKEVRRKLKGYGG